MNRQLRVLAAAAAAWAALGTAGAHAAITTPEELLLDSYETPNDQFAGPVTTSDVLAPGVTYAVDVTGTYSAYNATIMSSGLGPVLVCGTPENEPMIASPGRPASRVSNDAEFIFARPSPAPCPSFPYRHPSFRVDVGSGFAHPVFAPLPASPPASHAYSFEVTGQGAPASFVIHDTNTRDNDGVMRIVVRPASVPATGGSGASTSAPGSAPPNTAASSIGLPSARRCLGRRLFRIRIALRKDPVVRATVRVAGRRVKVSRVRIDGRRRLVARVDLRRFRRTRVTVDISARTRSGKILTGKRRYFTCNTKLPGRERIPL